jgi:hypothetical protein
MLTYSPPLPLIIDYLNKNHTIDTGDELEEGILLALQHQDRVCCIHLLMPVPRLQKLIMAMGDEFPILEYLYIASSTRHNIGLTLVRWDRRLGSETGQHTDHMPCSTLSQEAVTQHFSSFFPHHCVPLSLFIFVSPSSFSLF